MSYKFSVSRADVVIQQGDMCTTVPCVVWIDLIRKARFDLTVVAVDPSGGESGVLPFPIKEASPPGQKYTVRQRPSNDDFIGITVGRREGINHTLTFDAVPAATLVEGFGFVAALRGKVGGYTPDPSVTVPADVIAIVDPDDKDTDSTDHNVLYGVSRPPTNRTADDAPADDVVYTVKATTSNLKPSMLTLTSGKPSLMVEIIGTGTGTIEIGYHIWYDEDGTAAGKTKPAMWHSSSESLTVTVVPVK